MSGAGWGRPVLAALAVVMMSGCSDPPRQPPPTAPAAMGWFQPERFEDLPLWSLGAYRMVESKPQLAISSAGGAVRRLDLSYRSPGQDRGEAPANVLVRLGVELASTGWIERSRTTGKDGLVDGRWVRGDEELVVAAGRDGDATTVRLLLGPALR